MRQWDENSAQRTTFYALWTAVLALKLAVAALLPLFVDEAFYWQEGQHLAAAYSDLPGLTAWLARLGVSIGGNHTLALRLPFVVLGACVPFLVVRITAREFGPRAGWIAGCAALLMPLSGTLGLLALPDAAMAVATLLCVDAGACLLRRVTAATALELALGLAIGALSHYRFIAVVGVGALALLLLPDGRRALRDPRVWIAIALGASAWAPLVAWNLQNADAGLRFQLVDRHPWAFHLSGIRFLAVQAVLVTPLLFVALLHAAWRARRSALAASHYFALLGGLVVLGFFALGFFADTERVSFHWPLPGYLALLPLLPATLDRLPRPIRAVTWALAGVGLAAALAYYVMVSVPAVRAGTAGTRWYPSNFAGWRPLADAVDTQLRRMPPGTVLVGDSFKVGAELGFALDRPSIRVLDHPLNRKHGRAPQLALWGLQSTGSKDWIGKPALLVVAASEVEYKNLPAHYHDLCAKLGPLPAPRVLNIDHGAQRFLLFALDAPRPGPCTTPAMAWVDAPVTGATVGRKLAVRGWAFKDGVGLERVQVLLDGRPVGEARYGLDYPGLRGNFPVSNDPQHPRVGYEAQLQLDDSVLPGRHWLGLRMHGRDGSVEDGPEQPIEIRE